MKVLCGQQDAVYAPKISQFVFESNPNFAQKWNEMIHGQGGFFKELLGADCGLRGDHQPLALENFVNCI